MKCVHCSILARYNLYFAYKRSKIDKNMHATAVNCVMASLLIMQLILLFFNIVRASDKVGITMDTSSLSYVLFAI